MSTTTPTRGAAEQAAAELMLELGNEILANVPASVLALVEKLVAIAWLEGANAGAAETVAILRRELVKVVNEPS